MPRKQSNAATATIITVHVPLTFPIYGGRKAIISEMGRAQSEQPRRSHGKAQASVTAAPSPQRTENALLKALARAHRWRGKIEGGGYNSITELAAAENVNESYACRLLRLTLLAPVIINEILNQQQSTGLMLKQLMRPLPIRWDEKIMILKGE